MNEKERLDKLKTLIIPSKSNWMEEAQWREENRDWLKLSGRIAARTLTVMKARKMTQVQLAKLMDVTPQYVNKMLKGNEKFQIDTICKLEKCLGVKLLEVPTTTGLEYEAEGADTESASFVLEIFEKILYDSTQVAEGKTAYSSLGRNRSLTVGVSKKVYRRERAECKVIALNAETELFSEAM